MHTLDDVIIQHYEHDFYCFFCLLLLIINQIYMLYTDGEYFKKTE